MSPCNDSLLSQYFLLCCFIFLLKTKLLGQIIALSNHERLEYAEMIMLTLILKEEFEIFE